MNRILKPQSAALHGTGLWLVGVVAASVLALTACATPGTDTAPRPLIDARTAGLTDVGDASTLSVQWWTSLGDARLNALVEQALQGHPSLGAARARVGRVRALADQTRSTHGVQLGVTADATRERFSEKGIYPAPLAGNYWNLGNVQAGASWELDLFGRQDADWRAALGQERAAKAEAVAVRLSLASQVTRAYVNLARLVAQHEVSSRALAQRQEMLKLTRQRVEAGLDTQVELAQADAAVPDGRAQVTALDEQIMLARHQLAALTAQPPEALGSLSPRLDDLKLEALPAQLSADLLGRRPDVVAARWRVESAVQDVRSARAQFYPNVNLTAFAGLSAIGLDRVLDLGSRQVGIGPALRLPILDGGRLRAQLRGRQADLDASVAQYNSAVIDAVHEVADALGAVPTQARQREEVAQALAGAERAHAYAQDRYKAGLTPYLVVLNTETQVLAQRRQAVELQARRLDTQIQLMRALGGGWREEGEGALASLAAPPPASVRPPPSPDAPSAVR